MNNDRPTNQKRRVKAHVNSLGTTQLHFRNPYIIAWWSASFPGYGHLLLSKYSRGYLLFLWEIIVNNISNLNHAIAYSFMGNIERAKEVLEIRWFLLYVPVFLFAIWDSYRTTVDLNKSYRLAERENADINIYHMSAMEINYLDKRSPFMAVIWSLFMPGLGHLYIHRMVTSFFIMIWMIVFVYFSDALVAVQFLFQGDINQATQVLDPQWFLFIPSTYGYAIYDAYINTVESNKLYESEQRKFLKENYQKNRVKLPLT